MLLVLFLGLGNVPDERVAELQTVDRALASAMRLSQPSMDYPVLGLPFRRRSRFRILLVPRATRPVSPYTMWLEFVGRYLQCLTAGLLQSWP